LHSVNTPFRERQWNVFYKSGLTLIGNGVLVQKSHAVDYGER